MVDPVAVDPPDPVDPPVALTVAPPEVEVIPPVLDVPPVLEVLPPVLDVPPVLVPLALPAEFPQAIEPHRPSGRYQERESIGIITP
jgi:hypothetical protein